MSDTAAVAIVLITTEPGNEAKVYDRLLELKEVKEGLVLFGEYDIMLRIECADFGMLGSLVINNIRSLDGVETTKTLTVAPSLN